MLAKVGWRLICNPDSILARVLQAKYYPSSSFMDAPEMPTLVADLVDMGVVMCKYGKEGGACDLMRWVVVSLWRIWKCCHSLVFEKVAVEPLLAIQLLKQQWEELVICDEAQVQQSPRGQQVRRKGSHGWIKPPFGTLKINCDGAWCSQMGIGGVRWVARDFVDIFNGVGGWLRWLVWREALPLYNWRLTPRFLLILFMAVYSRRQFWMVSCGI
ncbi:hypothetical protein D8674_013393 [Pyrus ussuriensis x Pyrus communis]|uniref:Uncharacterized protein n=1 Tax=Pyrus ussuriensis x Pyrus communis TaxID=2448454 RepID=A0A5N5H350_9ROSA|nr:hypothetical protein D8674_013393 [Pyrus ussuriensis x Pyrus communis]